MACKAFLDTNIILDIFHRDRPFHTDAVQLFLFLDERKFVAFYSESVLTTIAYVLSKSMKSAEINAATIDLNKKIKLLPCFHSFPDKAVLKNPPDLEDALLYEIALHHEMDYFITSNIKDFKLVRNELLPVMNAKSFNKVLRDFN